MTNADLSRARGWRAALFAGMAALLCAPALCWLVRVPELGVQEMRPLAAWPEWRSTAFARWTSLFEGWLNDHVPGRTRLVQWNGVVRHRWLGEPTSKVVVGRDNWLFYVGEKTVPDLVGRDLLDERELDAWCQALEGRCAWWRERGANYLFVIAPNKSTIYPEKLPAFLRGQLKPGKLDQLIAHLRKKGCRAPVLDLRPVLFQYKAQATLYWPTDSHWNADGLLVSCDAIMRGLQEIGVPLRARDEQSWVRGERVVREGDCVSLLTMNGRWPMEPVTQLRLLCPPDARAAQTPLSALPLWKALSPWAQPLAFERDSGVGRTVMFCDSFFRVGGLASDTHAQAPLILNFQRFVSFWPWYGEKNYASHELLAAVAEIEKPTLVIEQWTERYLRTPPPDHPEFQRARDAVLAAGGH